MATTICRVCDVTEEVPLAEHLEARHMNVMLDIEVDPESDVATIRRETGMFLPMSGSH